MRSFFAVVLLCFSVRVGAFPARIHSFSPTSGALTGGTEVTLRGVAFTYACQPPGGPCPNPLPTAYFGGIKALSTTVVDDRTIVAVTPPSSRPMSSAVQVSISDASGGSTARQQFTYTGEPGTLHERILIPIFVSPTRGAFGSEFHTELKMMNSGPTLRLPVYGLRGTCLGFHCYPLDPMLYPAELYRGAVEDEFHADGTPGLFVYVADALSESLELQLRVFDVSRDRTNYGTQIPIVREREMRRGPVHFLAVPLNPLFRNMLRIYATRQTTVTVKIGEDYRRPAESRIVELSNGNAVVPAFAAVGDFPFGDGTVPVTVTPADPDVELWAFIAVTNNDTQHITIISPQR